MSEGLRSTFHDERCQIIRRSSHSCVVFTICFAFSLFRWPERRPDVHELRVCFQLAQRRMRRHLRNKTFITIFSFLFVAVEHHSTTLKISIYLIHCEDYYWVTGTNRYSIVLVYIIQLLPHRNPQISRSSYRHDSLTIHPIRVPIKQTIY